MSDDFKSTPPALQYFYKDKPIQKLRGNNYTKEEKIELIQQLWFDYESGMLDKDILIKIVLDNLYPSFTAQLILNDMMEKGILKKNPFTFTDKPIFKKKGLFDW